MRYLGLPLSVYRHHNSLEPRLSYIPRDQRIENLVGLMVLGAQNERLQNTRWVLIMLAPETGRKSQNTYQLVVDNGAGLGRGRGCCYLVDITDGGP